MDMPGFPRYEFDKIVFRWMTQFCVGMQQGNLVGMQQNPVGYAQAFYPVGNGQAFYPYGTMQPMTCNPMNQSMPSNNGKPM